MEVPPERVAEPPLKRLFAILKAEDGPVRFAVGIRVVPDVEAAVFSEFDGIFESLGLAVVGKAGADIDPHELRPHVLEDLGFARLAGEGYGKVWSHVRSIEGLLSDRAFVRR